MVEKEATKVNEEANYKVHDMESEVTVNELVRSKFLNKEL